MPLPIINKLEDLFSLKSKEAIIVDITHDEKGDCFSWPDDDVFEFKAVVFTIKSKKPIMCNKSIVLDRCEHVCIENVHFKSIAAKECSTFIYEGVGNCITTFNLPEVNYTRITNTELSSESEFSLYGGREFVLENCKLHNQSLTFCYLFSLIMKKVQGGDIFIRDAGNIEITDSNLHSLFIFGCKRSDPIFKITDNTFRYFSHNLFVKFDNNKIIENDFRICNGRVTNSLAKIFSI